MEDCSSSLLGCCRSRTPSLRPYEGCGSPHLAFLQSGVNVDANSGYFQIA